MQRTDIHVFGLCGGCKDSVQQALGDRRLARTRPQFFEGHIADVVKRYSGEPSPDLLIVESEDAPELLFPQVDRLAEVCRSGTELILLGPRNDVGLYRQLSRRGVSEYIPTPIDPGHLIDAVLGVCATPDTQKLGRLIAFIGASGGAGSTTIANNVAWRMGKLYDGEAAVVDLDLAFGTTALDFNLESPEDAAQALGQAERLDDQMLQRFVAKHSDNLTLLTGPGHCNASADIEPASVDRLLTGLRRNAAWVVADLPHYWGGWVRHVLAAADEIVVTAVPTLGSLRNAKSITDALNSGRIADTPVRVVLNRVGAQPKTDLPVKDFSATMGAAPAIVMPYEPALFAAAANIGHVATEGRKSQRVREPFDRLATLVSGRAPAQKSAGAGLLNRLLTWRA